VHELGVNVPEPPLRLHDTVPAGAVCVPALVSVSVTVHVLGSRLAVTGKLVQLTIVVVARRFTVIDPVGSLLPLWRLSPP